MTSYLSRLKQIDADNFINTPCIEVSKPSKAPFGTYDTSLMGHIVKNNSDDEVISNWWLIHFTDLDPVQVAIWPPCNHADALAFNTQAIAAEPIPSPIPKHKPITTAFELLDTMRSAGFIVSLFNGDLEVKQSRWVDNELADLIKQHKAGLINILKDNKQ